MNRDPVHPLRRARVAAGLTQRDLAHVAAVGLRTVEKAEAYEPTITTRTWQRLALALGTRPDAIRPADQRAAVRRRPGADDAR